MGGYGGALKQLSIGIASSAGKAYIHGAGKPEDIWTADHDSFLESMADAASSVVDYFKGNAVYINVMKNMSVDCDCCAVAEDPCMEDMGILISTDPIAIDQACLDLVYASDDPGRDHLLERIESRHGVHTIEAAAALGFGTREYELITVAQTGNQRGDEADMASLKKDTAYYHLPGLFEFYELYRVFLPLFYEHREYFYDWCDIGSIYGAPADCLWGGGRVGFGDHDSAEILALLREYGISARLTFSNSLLREEHLSDRKCNDLCALFEEGGDQRNGVIVHSDLLLAYLKQQYPGFYFVSSTTKVLTDFEDLRGRSTGRISAMSCRISG